MICKTCYLVPLKVSVPHLLSCCTGKEAGPYVWMLFCFSAFFLPFEIGLTTWPKLASKLLGLTEIPAQPLSWGLQVCNTMPSSSSYFKKILALSLISNVF